MIKSPVQQMREQAKQSCCSCKTYIEPSISDEAIIDISKASTSNYFLVFSKYPNIIYFITSFSLPSITNRNVTIGTPLNADSYKIAGHTTTYGDLVVNYVMDEYFSCYFNLVDWIKMNEVQNTIEPTLSRCSLIILNNSKMPIIRVDFKDVIPLALGEVGFQNNTSENITSSATFGFYNFSVTYLNKNKFFIPYDYTLNKTHPIEEELKKHIANAHK